MDGKRLYVELGKEKNYWVVVLALTTALIILTVMLTVKVLTGNNALILLSGVVALTVTLFITAALKVQHQATVLKLIELQLEARVPEKPALPANDQRVDLQA